MGYELLTYRELNLGGYAVAIKSNAATTGSNITPPSIKIRGRKDRENVSERRQARKINEVNGFQNCVSTVNSKAKK